MVAILNQVQDQTHAHSYTGNYIITHLPWQQPEIDREINMCHGWLELVEKIQRENVIK